MATTVELDIVGTKLASLSEEMCLALQRTSRSLYVRETADFACAVANPAGRFVAYPQAIGVSGFVGLDLADIIAAMAEDDDLGPGDVYIANDPYRTGGLSTHLPDIQMVAPYYADGEIIAYGWTFIHCSDIGGRVPSSVSPYNDTIFSEGLRIPPTKLVRRGETIASVERFILNNTRTPDANQGDFQAMIAALQLGERRMGDVVAQHGAPTVVEAQGHALSQAASKALGLLTELGDGTYRCVDYLDTDACTDLPVRVSATVRVEAGHLTIDFTGTDPQVGAAFNIATFGKPHSWITTRVLALMKTLDPLLPLNGGLMDSVSVIATPGSIMHAQEPAAVGVRHATASRINDVLAGALGQAAPEIMPAASSGLVVPVVFTEHSDSGQKVQVLEPMVGGTGARFGADGIDGRDSGISNLSNNPVETVETEMSVRVLGYRLRPDSAGPGRWRGGTGLELEFEALGDSAFMARGLERRIFQPWGGFGAGAAAPTELVVNPGTPREERLGLVHVHALRRGDRVVLRTSGAGGYGNPYERDLEAVLADVRRGIVSVEGAERDYGVVVRGEGSRLSVDEAATERLRASAEPPSSHGSAREAWDEVFPEADYDRFLAALYARGTHQGRNEAKAGLLREVLADLPAGFPREAGESGRREEARERFLALVDRLGRE